MGGSTQEHTPHRQGLKRFSTRMLIVAAALGAGVSHAQPAAENGNTAEVTVEAEAVTPAEVMSEARARDEAAVSYMMKCAGCHTIGGGALSGPDLKGAAGYPRDKVHEGVKRMEKNVGPLSEMETEALVELLLDPEAAARLTAHRESVQMQEAASLEPGNASKGEALYFGKVAFANGGISCAACHQAGGRGGNLATSLEDSFTRLGEQSLLSTTETPGFPVMRAMYTPHPVTKQEAVHIVKYLEEVAEDPAPERDIPLHYAGIGGAIAILLLMGKSTSKRAAGTRARMVAEAHRRNDRGCKCGRNS